MLHMPHEFVAALPYQFIASILHLRWQHFSFVIPSEVDCQTVALCEALEESLTPKSREH